MRMGLVNLVRWIEIGFSTALLLIVIISLYCSTVKTRAIRVAFWYNQVATAKSTPAFNYGVVTINTRYLCLPRFGDWWVGEAYGDRVYGDRVYGGEVHSMIFLFVVML